MHAQALLRNARDLSEIQLRNTAIQGLQPPTNSAGRNPRTRTRFWERDVFVPGTNNGVFRDNFRVPVFHAFPESTPPIQPDVYLPTRSNAFDATWVPRYTVSTHLPKTASACCICSIVPWLLHKALHYMPTLIHGVSLRCSRVADSCLANLKLLRPCMVSCATHQDLTRSGRSSISLCSQPTSGLILQLLQLAAFCFWVVTCQHLNIYIWNRSCHHTAAGSAGCIQYLQS